MTIGTVIRHSMGALRATDSQGWTFRELITTRGLVGILIQLLSQFRGRSVYWSRFHPVTKSSLTRPKIVIRALSVSLCVFVRSMRVRLINSPFPSNNYNANDSVPHLVFVVCSSSTSIATELILLLLLISAFSASFFFSSPLNR